jgi:phage regulator Rha-like protein
MDAKSDLKYNNTEIKNPPILTNNEDISSMIYFVRGHRIMVDADLAMIYNVETKRLKESVRRNIERFPEDFMFELTQKEYQFLRSQNSTLKRGEHSKYLPFAFTEHGAIMLASILRSPVAVKASIQVVRAFVKLRDVLSSNKELASKLEDLEKKYDKQFSIVFDAIRQLMSPEKSEREPVGFKIKTNKK